jgi:hypothetical protein
MKLAAITLLTFFLAGFASAQTADSTATAPQRRNGKQHTMDRFIDIDGDGICDHRSQGLGFRRKGNLELMKNSTNGTAVQTQSMTKGKQNRGGKK